MLQLYIFDIDDALLARMVVFSKKVALALEKVVTCKRVGVAVIGLEVPHAHIHLVPLNREGDISFSKERVKMTPDELRQLAEKISSEIVF